MRRTLFLLGLLLASTQLGLAQDAVPPVKVNYVVDAVDAKSGRATVEMTIQNLPEDEVTVAIPAWRPGSYRLLNYHRAVKEVSARADGKDLAVESVDKQTWKVKGVGKREVTVKYRLQPDPANIGREHYFIDGPGTYFYIVNHKGAACTVRFKLPEGWKAGSGLSDLGDGIFGARDYDTFADCPTELGKLEEHEFKEGEATYQLVVHAAGKWDSAGLIEALHKIVRQQCKMMGGAPYERYVFILHLPQSFEGAGGLEHLNSTNIALPWIMVREKGAVAASLCSHEFFHLWNVKRIRPAELGPFDYTQPVRSKALWWCEGVTSYYGDLTLARARVSTEEDYLKHLAREIETLQNNARRKVDSVETMSRQAWDGKPLDYYNRGEVIGWVLDMKVRAATGNEKSLDDVMRLLYQTYVVGSSKAGKGPIGVGYPEDGILKALNEVSGQDFTEFYRGCVGGVEELPLKEVAQAAGLELDLRVERTTELASSLQGARVVNVPAGSDDEKAGLKPGDRIMEVAGKKVTAADVRQEIGKLKAGEAAAFSIGRGGEASAIMLTPLARDRVRAKLTRGADASPKQQKLLEAWLGKESY